MSELISVNTRLPKIKEHVLIYCKPWKEQVVAYIQEEKRRGSFWFVPASENTGFNQDEVEWWQPLTPPPKDYE